MKLVEHLYALKLPFQAARIKCVAHMVLALIRVRSVNLAELAVVLNDAVDIASNYRRLQRFFAQVDFNSSIVGTIIFSLLPQQTDITICIDRTEWGCPMKRRNLLVATAVVGPLSVPIAWLSIPLGCSSTKDRIKLIERVLQIVPRQAINALVADREFFGKEWFTYLHEENIPFCIRLRVQTPTYGQDGKISVPALFPAMRNGNVRRHSQPRLVYGVPLILTAKRLRTGMLYLASTPSIAKPRKIYQRRWKIESFFQACKGRGFRLEATGLVHPDRIARLFSLVALTFTWMQLTGRRQEQRKARATNKHQRHRISLFRLGLDTVQQLVCNSLNQASLKQLRPVVALLIPP